MFNFPKFYCQGYMAIPVIEACRQRGLFRLLDSHEFRTRRWLIQELKANEGYFTIALETLVSLGWLEKNTNDHYRLTGKTESDLYLDLTPLYAIGSEQLVAQSTCAHRLKEKIEQVFLRAETQDSALLGLARGAIIVPLIVSLQSLDEKRFSEELDRLSPLLSPTVLELFAQQGWLNPDKRLTASGQALLQHSVFKIAVSYRLVLHGMTDLLFGGSAHVLDKTRERFATAMSPYRVDLPLEAFLENLRHELVEVLNRKPSETQSETVVQISCGDGILHAEISRMIAGLTAPGRSIRLVVPHNSLQAAEEALTDVTSGQEVLHLRIFADHRFPTDSMRPVNSDLGVLASDQPDNYLDQQGRLVDAVTVLSHWQHYLQAWAQNINHSHLITLQAHAVSHQPTGQQQQQPEFLDSDWIDRLTHEQLISAEAFITLAATAGLFNDGCAKRYPGSSAPCRISFHNFVKRDYIVRHAVEQDLERLWQLEKLCWRHSRTPKKQIRSRLREYPQGQFVLEQQGKIVGVIYSQRIAAVEALSTCNAAKVHKLHRASGPIVQLLAVNVDPQVQNMSYGDQLLEFMLQRCALMAGVEQVVGVTLCKHYDSVATEPFEQYIRRLGSSQDPILAFHQAHGAEIFQAIAGYRPQDHTNQGNGVLVSYNVHNRMPRDSRTEAKGNITPGSDSQMPGFKEYQISQFVRKEAARLLGISKSAIDLDRPVMEMGLDSADLLKLQQQFEDKFRLKFASGFFFEHNSFRKVIDHLTAKLVGLPLATSSTEILQSSDENRQLAFVNRSNNECSSADIAIIGMSCKLPGGIETPDQLWQVLASEKCVISSFPKARGRWPAGSAKPGIEQGGFVHDIDAFDAAFFRISPAEAQRTDPQQRILLELAWTCLEDANVLPAGLKGTRTGVFIGASNCDYSRLIQESGEEVEAHYSVGNSLAVLANRISYFFDLSGPSLLIDTACSSSLVALHTAIQSLRAGECTAALVGGVNLICHPDLSIAYHKAGMLAPDGTCKVFDARANGYVRSEGAVMVLLKPLSAAIAEGNQVHAVIKGSAINHGGLAGGLTVPNPQKQSELLQVAWKSAGIAPQDLTYIETHGTGTSLGDPIEIQGIQNAYSQSGSGKKAKACAIGSVKSNLGHLESAAGITGLLKVVVSMQHRQLPASINFAQLNPKSRLEGTPLYVQERLSQWNTEGLRLAAVSSFGSGGANAHIVVQEYVSNPTSISDDDEYLFVLSAADQVRLKEYVKRVIGWLQAASIEADFADAMYCWQVGRTAMKQRLAIKATNSVDLLNKLKQWLAGDDHLLDVWMGQANLENTSIGLLWQSTSGHQLIDKALFERDLEQLAIMWTSGVEIEWRKLHSGKDSHENKPRFISLPTYPFARERYWINAAGGHVAVKDTRGVLHPLLHNNTSDLSGQRYSSTFTGQEFFLTDHQIATDDHFAQRVLPEAAHLEMVRAAIQHACPGTPGSTLLELHNMVWGQPVIVTGDRQVNIRLLANENDQID